MKLISIVTPIIIPVDGEISAKHGVPEIVLTQAILEHPAIKRLMLNKEQRLFVGRLEYEEDGVKKTETGKEMMFRREWRTPIEATQTRTANQFVSLNTDAILPSGKV